MELANQHCLLDVEAIRRDFPILAETPYGKPLVYLDNAASAQKPRQLIEKMNQVMEHGYANVHRGLHYLSNSATAQFEDARKSVQGFVNAEHEEEIIFCAGATDAINLVASSYLQPRIQAGDEIIISVLEHHANIVPWHFLRETYGAVIKWVPLCEQGGIDLEAFKAMLSPRTRFVALTQMSNVLGFSVPLEPFIAAAHAQNIPVLIDGCQGAVHLPTDVQALDCDFYVMSGHKLYGPTGIGVLYGKRDLLQDMRPYRGGGEMIEEVHEDHVTYAGLPHRFEAGTPPIIEAIGLGAALTYMQQFDQAEVIRHENKLGALARRALGEISSVRVFGPADYASPIVSFIVDGAHAHDIATVLDRSGIAVRAGHHCAQPLMRRLGVAATARASFAIYNTEDEVNYFAQALERAVRLFT